jgi:nicotinate-nucleotide adenylyltransferase
VAAALSDLAATDVPAPRVETMEVPALAISSSDIRARVATRRPVRYLLPEDVASYIEKNGLYREPVA